MTPQNLEIGDVGEPKFIQLTSTSSNDDDDKAITNESKGALRNGKRRGAQRWINYTNMLKNLALKL